MANYKTVPNQKVVKVDKVETKGKIFAQIEMDALQSAAQSLDAGAFKLWVYFAKNQKGFEFALSSKDVLDTFGMKIKQYNNAVDELIEKGYLVAQGGNKYLFSEVAVKPKGNNEKESVMPKSNNAVITKKDNAVITKSNNQLFPLGIRNNTDITQNNTIDNTEGEEFQPAAKSSSLSKAPKAYQKVSKAWLESNGIEYRLQVANLGYVVATGALIEVIE